MPVLVLGLEQLHPFFVMPTLTIDLFGTRLACFILISYLFADDFALFDR